jgi:uncharacterized protein YfaS (alpha-2-macroglobulin family)
MHARFTVSAKTLATLAFSLSLASPLLARADKLAPLLIGNPPASTDRLNLSEVNKAKPTPLFVVVDTPYEIWSGQGTYLHVAVYDEAFAPVNGATVYLGTKPVGMTDEKGTVVVRNIPRQSDDAGDVSEQWLRAVLVRDGKTSIGEVPFSSYARTPSFESDRLFVYTDRGVYNPGQPILLRVIGWELKGDYKPLVDKEVEIMLLDSRGHVVAGAKPQTDAFGAASLSLPLPDRMPEGNYTLAAQIGQERAQARLRIERITPPSIDIEHTLRRYFTRSEKSLDFTVTLKSFSGAALHNGQLQVTVQHNNQILIDEKRAIDGSESYAFSFADKPIASLKEQLHEGEHFSVVITATDNAGRSDSVRRDLQFVTNPYTAVIEFDKNEYTIGEQVQVQVKLVDIEGVPVRNRQVRLEVEGAKTPKPVNTDANGVALFRLIARSPEDGILVSAFLSDVDKALAQSSATVLERKAMTSKVEQPVVHERRRVSIQVNIQSGYEPTEQFVHGDVVDSSGALVSAFLVPITHEGSRTVARGDFVAPTWGTMLLTLFCAAKKPGSHSAPSRFNVGLLVEGQQITVHPDRALKVELRGLPEQAKPGQSLSVEARITDPRGRKVDAEVGASVVDAAVLSLLNPLETTPEDRFYDPELKVLSNTGSEILTWPVVSRNWGLNLRDIALPPFDFDQPDDRAEFSSRGHAGVGYGYGAVGSFGAGGYGTGAGSSSSSVSYESVGVGNLGAAMDLAASGPPGKVSMSPSSDAPSAAKDVGVNHGVGAGTGALAGRSAEPAVQITIRTRFPETALWLPEAQTKDGTLRFNVTLPDAVTHQAITLVASDKHGGIGMSRHDLPVKQEVSARSDLPASLTSGDEVEVRASLLNLGEQPRKATLRLSSSALEVIGPDSRSVEAPPHLAVSASFRVRASKVGAAPFTLTAEGPGFSDTEQRTLTVLPRGPFATQEHRGTLSRTQTFEKTIEIGSTEDVDATLSLSFPTAATLLSAFTNRDLSPWMLLEEPGAGAVIAYQVERVLTQMKKLTPERRTKLQQAYAEDAALLASSALADGSYAYARTGEASTYLTAKALAGLSALQKAGQPVDMTRLQQAVTALFASQTADGLFDTSDVAFWEGDTLKRREALSAEIYRTICEAGPGAVPSQLRSKLEALGTRMMTLAESSDDPLTAADAALGQHACTWLPNQATISDDRIVSHLIQLRRTGHWEPSWFNAYGGTLEATAAVVEVLARDPVKNAAELRESAQYLLGTRSGFGNWRNGAGTVAVLRALAAFPSLDPEVRSQVRVEVNGHEVTHVDLPAGDPFDAALPLTHLSLTHALKPGNNVVKVSYDGALQVPLLLEERRQVPRASSEHFEVARVVKANEVHAGDETEVELVVSAKQAMHRVAIEEPVPANAAIDPHSLDELQKQGAILEYRLDEHQVVLYLRDLGPKQVQLHYRLFASRSGRADWAPTRVRPIARPEWTESVGTQSDFEVK